jgi:outer membrane lipoprotein-sorting protein
MPFAHTRVSTLFTKPQTRKGVLYFSPVHGLALAYTHPENYTILMQENQALMLDSNDVRRIQLSRHPFFKGMLSLFTEPFTNVRRYFDIPVCRSEDGVMHMELVPRRARGVTDITVELDEATGHMRRVEIQEESGDQQTIVFSPAMMQTVPDAYFTPAHWSPLGEAWMPVER